MLDGVRSGQQGAADARSAVGVNGDLAAPHVRLFDDGVHLFLGQLLAADRIPVRQDAARRHELDQVRAVLEVLPDLGAQGPRAVRSAFADMVVLEGQEIVVGMTARRADRRAGHQHPRAFDLALVDRIAQGDVRKAAGADIAHGGEAGFQGLLGVGDAIDRFARRGEKHAVEAFVIGVRGHMDVRVDQSRQDRRAAQLDLAGPVGRNQGRGRTDGADLVAGNDDHLIIQHFAADRIHQPARVNGGDLLRSRGCGEGCRQCEDGGS